MIPTHFFIRLLFTFCFLTNSAFASSFSDTLLVVNLNRHLLAPNDTVTIEATQKKCKKLATLHIWIEEKATGRRWHYRYPMINGYVNIAIKVGSQQKDGTYDFGFSVQEQFAAIKGKWISTQKEDKQSRLLSYFLLTKGKSNMAELVQLDDELNFTLPNLLFEDSAYLFFSKPGKKKTRPDVFLETPLDSMYVPDNVLTKTIRICSKGNDCIHQSIDTSARWSDWAGQPFQTILPTVSLNSKSQNSIRQFEKENVTGIFSGYADFVFDGFTDEALMRSPDLFLFLATHVNGMRVSYDGESGLPYLTWRKNSTDIFLNEIRMDRDMPLDIMPSDVAMIKVYRPGTTMGLGSGDGGTVAIYLKNGIYSQSAGEKYRFKVFGYNAMVTEWK